MARHMRFCCAVPHKTGRRLRAGAACAESSRSECSPLRGRVRRAAVSGRVALPDVGRLSLLGNFDGAIIIWDWFGARGKWGERVWLLQRSFVDVCVLYRAANVRVITRFLDIFCVRSCNQPLLPCF